MAALRQRPLWRWILLALSPSLAYVGFASFSFVVPPLAGLSVFMGVLVIPLVALGVLVHLANSFFEARNDPSALGRFLFVVGFGLVNAVIWFGGCSITAFNLDANQVPPKQQQRQEQTNESKSSPST
jgi:hypothetical protein